MTRIAYKFILTVSAILLLTTLLFLWITINAIQEFGRESLENQSITIRSQAYDFLGNSVSEHADKYQEKLKRISLASAMLARQTGFLLRHTQEMDSPAKLLPSLRFIRQEDNGIFYSQDGLITSLYWGGPELPPAQRQEMEQLQFLHPAFLEAVEEIPEAIASHTIILDGFGIYCSLSPEARANIYKLPPPQVFDVRDGEPLSAAGPENNPEQRTIWTAPYKDDVHDGLSFTASTPYYNNRGDFAGIAGIDITLDRLAEDIINPTLKGALPSLFTMLLDDRSGVIALAPEHFQTLGLDLNLGKMQDSTDTLTIGLADSSIPTIRIAATRLTTTPRGISTLQIKGETYLLAHQNMPDSKLILAKMVKEKDMLASLTAAELGLSATTRAITRRFLTVSLGIMVIAITLVVMVITLFTRPIRELTTATRRVQGGELNVRIQKRGTHDELGQLTNSFNTMIQGLEEAHQREKEYARDLEETVDLRTGELQEKNQQLQETLSKLLSEVSVRREMEKELCHYERIISVTSDLIALVNKDCTYQMVNAAYLTAHGRSRNEIIGHTIAQVVGEEPFTRHIWPLFKRCLAGEEVSYQIWYTFKGSGRRFIFVTYTPYLDLENKLDGVLVSIRDITPVKEAEERTIIAQQQMVHSEKMAAIGRLVAGISHELNNAINFITGALPSLKRQLGILLPLTRADSKTSQACDNLQILTDNINEGSRRLTRIVSGLTTFSRRGGELRSNVNVNKEIKRLLSMAQPQSKSISIETELVEPLPFVNCVPEELVQALLNILLNAFQVLGQEGTVTIRTRLRDRWVVIEVSDTGPGLDPEIGDKIFEPFFTTKEVGEGTGLGLSICHDIITKFGGTITVACEPGQGAVFTISLPAVA